MSLPLTDPTAAGGTVSDNVATLASSAVNNTRFVFHIDIFIIAFIGGFVLLSFPRALARFSRSIEWRHGHILRSTTLHHGRHRGAHDTSSRRNMTVDTLATTRSAAHPQTSPSTFSVDTRTAYGYRSSRPQSDEVPISPYPRARRSPFPPHVREWSNILHPLAPFFRHRVDLGFSVGQCVILSGYFGILLYASLYKSSLFTDPLRTGFVAMSQIPFVVAFATKNNLIGMLIGAGYERLNYIHRFSGKIITLASDIHVLGYVYKWTAAGTFVQNISRPNIAWGVAAAVFVNILAFGSTSYWRQKFHNTFFAVHVVAFVLFLVAVSFHGMVIVPYVLAAVGFYSFDLFCRLLKTRVCTARLRPLPSLSMTRIEIPQLNAGWRAGQHVRVRILSTSMGWWGWTECHPLTIASMCKGPEGLVLMCKKAGGWTDRLFEVAKSVGYEDRERGHRHITVMIEGPYGGPGHTVFASYSAAVFVVGGSGVSFALSAVQELVQKDLDGHSRIKVIELIWCIQDPASLTPLIPLFTSLLQETPSPLRISVFYTRANTTAFPPKESLPPGLTLTTGRPKLAKVLDVVLTRCVTLGSGVKDSEDITGVIVGTCGPVGLSDDVCKAIGRVDARRRKAVGGIELHEEVFGW
ncbi:hypothetical protein PLICRDRAFT_56591 [Plicaturopsis crispa FD-325 SS-3]|nr:hypothetical protein PLICRDRAFT_56591 [Plicaturopsis crispa FD-325 SS-3]